MTKPSVRTAAIGMAIALAVSACGSGSSNSASADSADAADLAGQASQAQNGDGVEFGEDGEVINDLDSVAFTPGQVSHAELVINGTAIEYSTLVPEGFDVGDTAPVLLAIPPGSQNLQLNLTIMAETYGRPALDNGWVVVSPAAPPGQLYHTGAEALIPDLMEWINGWVTPEGGRPHLIGISNGGLSAFRIAGAQPEAFASITAYPGFPNSAPDVDALSSLTDTPIRMFVGGEDELWVQPMEQTADLITELNGDVELEVFPGEGHFIRSLSDGIQLFEELETIRQTDQQ